MKLKSLLITLISIAAASCPAFASESLSDTSSGCTTLASYPYANAQMEYYYIGYSDQIVYGGTSVSAKVCTGYGFVHAYAEVYAADSDSSYNGKVASSASVWSPYGYYTGTAVTDSDTLSTTSASIESFGLYTTVYASQINSQSGTVSWSATATIYVY